jgi:hypothetical protein
MNRDLFQLVAKLTECCARSKINQRHQHRWKLTLTLLHAVWAFSEGRPKMTTDKEVRSPRPLTEALRRAATSGSAQLVGQLDTGRAAHGTM